MTIQDYYLELVAAWGELPIDKDEVMNILHRIIKDTATIKNALKDQAD